MFDRLFDELARLVEDERFANEPKAIEALEAVKYWAIEEGVDYDRA